MANTTMGETLFTKDGQKGAKKSETKIKELEAKIEHEKRMRELAESEVHRLKGKLK